MNLNVIEMLAAFGTMEKINLINAASAAHKPHKRREAAINLINRAKPINLINAAQRLHSNASSLVTFLRLSPMFTKHPTNANVGMGGMTSWRKYCVGCVLGMVEKR
jgi:hypothetical protein